MSDNGSVRPGAPPLPATVQDLDALRKSNKRSSLNDIVEQINRELWPNPDYQKYFWAIWPEETQEGSFQCDDVRAAIMIQKYAEDHGITIPPNSNKLSPIVKSLHVVMARYENQTRKARREAVLNGTDE